MITQLEPHQILVVGTNLNGFHGGGAAKQAYEDFGLEWGCAEGLCGQTFAFPTLDKEMKQVSEEYLKDSIKLIYKWAKTLPEKEFLLTAVGEGIAGFDPEYIRGLFGELPPNMRRV